MEQETREAHSSFGGVNALEDRELGQVHCFHTLGYGSLF